MVKMDVVVEGRVLLDKGLTDCCIGIEDGRIVKVAKTIGKADKRFDFSGRMVMPSGIDLHVHFREPGMTNKEDFATGSAAAACGGVSFVADMPNTKPPTRSISDLKEKESLASKKSFVDFGLAGLLDMKSNPAEMAGYATCFKIYLGATTGNLGVDESVLGGTIRKATMRPVFIHAEHIRQLPEKIEKNLKDHDSRRSEGMELEAASKVISERDRGTRVHLLHVSQSGIIGLAKGAGCTSEVTPHHLLLDIESMTGANGKINPPLRSKKTRIELWNAFAAGKSDTIGSDHSPHTIEEKSLEFDAAPSGMPGVETLLPLMLQKVAERKLDIEILSRCCSSAPASLVGLKKGKIEVGMDADFIVVDLNKSVKINADRLHSKCGWTPSEGMEGVFPLATFIRGNEVARDGELSGDRVGRFVRPGEGR